MHACIPHAVITITTLTSVRGMAEASCGLVTIPGRVSVCWSSAFSWYLLSSIGLFSFADIFLAIAASV